MARGRMINKTIGSSMQFHQLPDDTCRLLATWIIAHLDCNGVFYADPNMVRSLVFTRRGDVSLERIEQYLQAMEDIGLIVRFKADGERWQYWPGFDRNQPGLRKDRETTNFPPPPISTVSEPADDGQNADSLPDECRQDDGNVPDECRQDDGEMYAEVKLREGKLSEVKLSNDGANAPASPPGPKKKPKPAKPPPTALLPDTDSSRFLFGQLQAEARAKGRRGAKKFPSLACKTKFDGAAARLGNDETKAAIKRAMEIGIGSVPRVTDYVAKWRSNGRTYSADGDPTGGGQFATGPGEQITEADFASDEL